jgi:hypothetical protein
VDSVQEAYTKCFAVHILKVEISGLTLKKWSDPFISELSIDKDPD